jgi:hypothetical protein
MKKEMSLFVKTFCYFSNTKQNTVGTETTGSFVHARCQLSVAKKEPVRLHLLVNRTALVRDFPLLMAKLML